MLDACEFSLCTKLNELDNACKKKERLFLFFFNCKFSPVEENPLGIPINIKVSKTHLCSVSDQFVTQRNEMALQKYYLEQILMSAKCYSRIMY